MTTRHNDLLFGDTDGHEPHGRGVSPHTLHRRSDPDTSREAAEQVASHITADRAYALACVTEMSGCTARELEAHYGVHPEGKVRKRLVDLERVGLVYRGVKRRCRINGTKAAIWWPTDGAAVVNVQTGKPPVLAAAGSEV
jgi:hypothetical protein